MAALTSTPKVAIFIPCFVDQLVPQVGQAMVRVLERAGCRVAFPEEQTCCGQAPFSTGYWDDALPLARRFVKVFSGAEAVVCPSGSCATMVRRFYPELARADAGLRRELAEIGGSVFEFSEFLVRRMGITDVGARFPHRVAFHDACHLLRELGVHEEPRKLLRAVRGLELVEMAEPEECCGFGGAFAISMSDVSAAMGDRKVRNIEQASVDYVTSCDATCLMQIGGILSRRGGRARAIHLAEILASDGEATKQA
ncbi:MAG TPA: (Fe-S)-binding protein [Candidatus Dormibacteraeota bacterium]|nr:(Fe-S)-binding protein [Candidatus Dormibacteraeota bacterium]